MKTYTLIFAERNGSGSLTLSFERDYGPCSLVLSIEEDGRRALRELVKSPQDWRTEEIQDSEGNSIDF